MPKESEHEHRASPVRPAPRGRRAIAARRGSALLAVALAWQAWAGSTDALPFMFDKPALLSGPEVSRSLLGSTYAYTALKAGKDLRLLITVMRVADVRAELGALSGPECVQMFLQELRSSYAHFFAVAMTDPLAVGTATFPRFRWTGEDQGRMRTGVLGCGVLGDRYYVVHMVDDLRSAVDTFPGVRASLRSLVPTGQ